MVNIAKQDRRQFLNNLEKYNDMLNDNSPMPWGKYKGEKMANVPADYLMWLHDNNKCSGAVRAYIEDNLDVIEIEIKRKKK